MSEEPPKIELPEEHQQELLITGLVEQNLAGSEGFNPESHQALAYCIAQLTVQAKKIYTEELPKLVGTEETDESSDVMQDVVSFRMQLLQMYDLIEEFEFNLLKAMSSEEEEDEDEG